MRIRFPDGVVQEAASAQGYDTTASGSGTNIRFKQVDGTTAAYAYACASVAEQARFLYELQAAFAQKLDFWDLITDIDPTGGMGGGGTAVLDVTTGPAAGGTAVLVTGNKAGFKQNAQILFGAYLARNIVWFNNNLISCKSPPQAAGAVHVYYQDQRVTLQTTVDFTYT